MLGPLIDALTPYLPGWLELPEAHGAFAWGFAKGRIHKYIKRVPKPGGGYRYYYNAAHGGTVAHAEHFVAGASFKDPEGHWHIKSKDGDTLHLRHDETGEERKMTHAQLAEHLGSLHGATIKQAREAATKALSDAREAGASKKQIARLEERARRVGVDVAKEAQRAAFEAHRKATGEFHPWDPAERTPVKAKAEAASGEGVEYVRAPAGGATSEVDGKFYRGGQLMPIHGKFSGREKFKPTGEGDGASRRADDEGDGPARRRYTEEDIARGLAEAKERKDIQSLRDGVFGRFLYHGKRTPTRNSVSVDSRKWREFASEIGPAKMGAVIRALESAYAAIPGVASYPGAAEYDFGRLKELAGLTQEGGGVRVERKVPGTHYAHQLMTSMLNGHDNLGANELESAVKLNEIIGGAIGGDSPTPADLRAEADQLQAKADRMADYRPYGNQRTKSFLKRTEKSFRQAAEAQKVYAQAKALRSRADALEAGPQKPLAAPSPPRQAPVDVEPKVKNSVKADQKRRGVTPERAAAESAFWAKKHKDFKSFMDGVPSVYHRGSLVSLGDIPMSELGA